MPPTRTAPQQTPRTTTVDPPAPDASLLDQAILATVDRLEKLSGQCLDQLNACAASTLRKGLVTANAIQLLDRALTPQIMAFIMKLMNTPLGFLTDKDPLRNPKLQAGDAYDDLTVKRVVIEALLKGVSWTDNEFNIISGRLYITQEGYRRKCGEVPGLTDLELIPSAPQLVNGVTLVRVGGRWKLDGQANELRDAKGEPGVWFPVASSQYATADNLIGKAKRKAYKMIFERVTGSAQSEPEEDATTLQQAIAQTVATGDGKPTRTDALADRLAPKAAERPAEAPAEKAPPPSSDGKLFGPGDAYEGPHAEGA